ACFDNGARIAALAPKYFEQVLGNLAGNRAVRDQVEDAAELRGGYRRGRDFLALFIKPPEQVVDHPVRGSLRVAALRYRLEVIGGLAFGHQHGSVIGRQAELGDESL